MSKDFYFLNVGKGNCTIIDFPSGHLSIIDIDDSRTVNKAFYNLKVLNEKVAPLTNPVEYIDYFFKNREIFRFILTHPDMDHLSGIKKLFEDKSVINFWDTDNNKKIDVISWLNSSYDKNDWDFYQEIRNKESSPKALKMHRGVTSECCWVEDGINILSPNQQLLEKAEKVNDFDHSSMVINVECFGRKVLLGGDATLEAWHSILEDYGNYLKSDVLLAPNHGSDNHISKDLLDIIDPRLTVISVEVGSDYSDIYKRHKGLVLSTKYYGDITVSINDNGNIYFRTQCKDYRNNWHIL